MAKYEIKDGIAIIPEGTQEIEDRAFSWCKELTFVTIPDSDLWDFKIRALQITFECQLAQHQR